MVIKRIQQKKSQGNGGSVAVAFDSNVKAGSLIVVGVNAYIGSSPTATISDNHGDTYNTIHDYNYQTDDVSKLAYAYNATGGATTVTITFSANPSYYSVVIAEYGGVLASSDPLDQKNESEGSSSTPNSGNITTTTADQMLIGWFGHDSTPNSSITPDSAWTQIDEEETQSSNMPFSFIERRVTSTGTYAASWTLGDSHVHHAVVASFKAASPSYSFQSLITVDNTKVSGSTNLTDFPVLVSGTFDGTSGEPDLRRSDSGGNIQNTDSTGGASGAKVVPADLAFYDDTSYTTRYDHEIVHYNLSTGSFIARVRVPTLSYNSDTTFYMFYGDSSLYISQESVDTVWRSEYKGVWNLNEGSGTRYDSSGNGNDLADNNTVTTATGKVAPAAAHFEDATSESLSIANASITDLLITGDVSISFWINVDNFDTTYRLFTTGDTGDVDGTENILYMMNCGIGASEGKLTYLHEYSTGTNESFESTNKIISTAGTWYHIAFSRDVSASEVRFVYDGTYEESFNYSNQPADGSAGNFFIGVAETGGALYLEGSVEAFKIYAGELSDDWFTTEYNNENAPSTFLSVGNESGTGGGGTLEVIVMPGIQDVEGPKVF